MNKRNLKIMIALSLIAILLFLVVDLNLSSTNLILYALKRRIPKIIVIVITAFAIGGASLVFQSIISNTIVTPCLLGMNSLYTLLHTLIFFFLGSGSLFATNANLAFLLDLIVMSMVATAIYSYMFKKTQHNILYVLLIGTVLTSLFTSFQSSFIRVMDSNEYDTLLTSLVAGFDHINSSIIIFAIVVLLGIIYLLRNELKLLDVISLGKDQAINLGVDYDKTIQRLLLGVVLCIIVATALVGPISFLGLIIANLARQLFKTYKHSYLIIGSSLFGVIILLFGQMIIEHVFVYSIPISVFITVSGGIYFLYLLLRRNAY